MDKHIHQPGGPRQVPFLIPTEYPTIDRFGTNPLITDVLKTPGTLYDVPRVGEDDLEVALKARPSSPTHETTRRLIILQLHVASADVRQQACGPHALAGEYPRASAFQAARRMARWYYQWMVIHEFLPAIVGKATADAVYKENSTGAPTINIKYYKPRNRTGRPFIPIELRWPHTASATASPGPATPFKTTSPTRTPAVAVSSVPLFEAEADRETI